MNTKKPTTETIPTYKKYSKSTSMSWLDPSTRLKPSDLAKPSLDVIADDYPMIIEFNNMKDNTSQIHSTVDIDQPLFFPSPKVVVFDDYAPFTVHEKKLYFRNNDSVARRIKIVQPDGPFFEISAPKKSNGELLKQSKIAAGMEICYIVKFKPQEVRDYSHELVCWTERERFIVPIRAVGMRPRLSLPDQVRFGNCPIKTPTRETLLLQNTGSSVARFKMRSTNSLFSCPGEEMVVDPGASRMVELFFTPLSSQSSTGDLVVEFSKGVVCYIELFGSGTNVDVSLSTSSLTLEPAYISLSSQKTLKIKNMSDLPIQFTWKSFANEDEEEAERNRLLSEIQRMEALEMAQLKHKILSGYYGSISHNTHSYSTSTGAFSRDGDEMNQDPDAEEETREEIPFAALADEASLSRKYRHLRKALASDPLQFVDDIFDISPSEGQVWANSYKEITVSFRPDTAALFSCVGYLDISGMQDRLSLHLSGQGIGPLAALSFDVLDVGDVFTNDEQTYSLAITNKGDIPAQWSFMSSLTRFGSKFHFSPTEGSLLPGQTEQMTIKFESEVLGEFCEYFRFALQGNEDMLVCQIKGHVIGPSFHFDSNSIDFGKVSFDYLHTTTIRLVNTSKVSMCYRLRIPQDDAYGKKEFNLEPSEGLLHPGEGADILVEFIPSTVKVYDYSLTVAIMGIGDMLLSIPVRAECVVSSVGLETKEIDFGDCFLRFPYSREITLTNLSDSVRTKFEILPQSQMAKAVAAFEAQPSVAVVEPNGKCVVTLTLITEKLGKYRIPIQIAIAGSQEPPIQAGINYNTIGPRVLVNCTELRWGSIECLRDSIRTIRLTNDSLIPASLKFFLKTARSKFDVTVKDLLLKPGEEADLDVTANLDDSVVVKDELHAMVEDGDSLMVPLSAKGVGTTMYCKDNLTVLDLGVQLTGVVFERRVVLENKGRRPQFLHWVNRSVEDENRLRAANAKKLGKDSLLKVPKNLMPLEAVFSVTPAEITLRPRTGTTFTFKGICPNIGPVQEHFVLESRVGKERVLKEIIQTDVKCEIVNPLLEFSAQELRFSYAWARGNEPSLQQQPVILKNISPIALTFVLRTDIPFNLSSWEHTLAPGESLEVTVDFDPGYKDDRQSHSLEKQLSISYRGHTQKDFILLKCAIAFPNLTFESQIISFGCILNDTSKVIKMKTNNVSQMTTNFEWILMEQKAPTQGAKGRAVPVGPPLNHVVDILPIRSCLEPGDSEDVEFSMNGGSNSKINGFAVCVVEGGPEYKFPLTGEASTVSYSLDRSLIDFGKTLISEKHDQEISITNTGKVAFHFEAKHGSPGSKEVVELIPMTGKVQPGQTQKIIIRLRPGLPLNQTESLSLQVAHFEPVPLILYYQGIFPSAVVNLPRYKKLGPFGEVDGSFQPEEWDDFTSQAHKNCLFPDLSSLPPSLESPLPPISETSALAPYLIDPDLDPLERLGITRSQQQQQYSNNNQLATTTTKHSAHSKQQLLLFQEKEMQRMVFARSLEEQIQSILENQEEPIGLQAIIAKNINIESIVIASYVVDFGNVIIGQTRKRVFKVTNASVLGQLNWSFDKNLLMGSGYSVDPERVQKLPEQGTVDITIKYFARLQQKLGRKILTLPLESKGSPRVNLILTSNICLPEIEVSSESVEMGKVLIGRSRKIYISFLNTSPVTATWSFKKVVGKEEAKINIQPQEGSLRAGKKTVLCIEFMPSEARKYRLELLLKVENNTKPKLLVVTGDGVGSPIRFDPPHLELGPVIPFTDGDEKTVTVTNISDYPIEIFSLDFDDIYKKEEEITSSLDLFDEEELYRSSIRDAGEPLPQEILKLHDKLSSSPSMTDQETEDQPKGFQLPLELASLRIPSMQAPRDASPPQHQDFLVLGPPVSGVSSLAAAIGKKLQLVVKTVDQILAEVASTKSHEGELCRKLLGLSTPSEKAELDGHIKQLEDAAEQSKIHAVEEFKKANKKAKEIPPEVYLTVEVKALESFLQSEALGEEALVEIFQFRMSWEDAAFGFVFDGACSNVFEDTQMIISALKTTLPSLIVSHISIPPGSAESYSQRLGQMLKQKREDLRILRHSIKTFQDMQNKLKGKSVIKKPKAVAVAQGPTDHTGAVSSQTPRKSPREKASGVAIDLMNTADLQHSIPPAIPIGDEPWIDQESGLVQELDSQDFKALEDNQKGPYLRQLLYQLLVKLEGAITAIHKINSVYSERTGKLRLSYHNPSDPEPEPEPEPEDLEMLASARLSEVGEGGSQGEGLIEGEAHLNEARMKDRHDSLSHSHSKPHETEHHNNNHNNHPPRPTSAKPTPPHSSRSNKPSSSDHESTTITPLTEQTIESSSSSSSSSSEDPTSPSNPVMVDPSLPPENWIKLTSPTRTCTYSHYEQKILPGLDYFLTAEQFEAQLAEEQLQKEGDSSSSSSTSSSEGQADQQSEQVSTGLKVREYGLFDIALVEGDETEQAVASLAMALLPPPKVTAGEKTLLPPTTTHQIFRKSVIRPDRKPIRLYQIIRVPPPKTPEQIKAEEDALLLQQQQQEKGKRGKPNNTKDQNKPGTAPSTATDQQQQEKTVYRWVIPANSSVDFKVRFRSINEGKFDCSMGFEVLGTRQLYSLYCSGVCEVPKVNTDSRNIFMKRIRALNPLVPPPQRRFAIADNTYSFGPLLKFKKPEWRAYSTSDVYSPEQKMWQLIQTNTDVLRITNNGRYKCQVSVCFEDLDPESKGIFSAEPTQFEIEEGDTGDIRIWAFPPAIREYMNKIIICISDNPQPLVFPLLCAGVEPSIELRGPWTESLLAMEETVAKCTDKKQLKELEAKLASIKEANLLDFSRILVGKNDTRTFEVQNTSLLPVAWAIDKGDFSDSPNIHFLPASGVLPPNATTPITVAFTSPTPLLVSGKFSLRFSDAEGGLEAGGVRLSSLLFKVVAEAYDIRAVSLTSEGQEDHGNEIDFGLIRVGDTATQTMQMGNRGKYKISFKLQVTKPALAQILKIEPSEGEIEPGNKLQEIKISFCTTNGELTLKNNKDVQILISEPLTGEQVERFPLLISTIVKYNKLRVQPSKGMQFGAVRFDSEPRVKRVEVRNEGNFPFAFVICPGMSEHDELDTLDAGAFSAYAYYTPAASRLSELGDRYLERIMKGGDGKKKAPEKKAAAKGKGGRPGTASTDSGNPLVQDPDGLVLGPIPEEPLVLGSFVISPRVAVVEPGQSVGIDMRFSPSGSQVMRESLRFCISGADPNDSLIRSIRSFDLTAESCFPAIVTDDVLSIFEEQEVVSMLSDIGKLEKLPVGKVVYAEAERMLAFGPVMCNQSGGKGVCERIRISNPTKIDVKVNLKVSTGLEEEQSADKNKAAAKKPVKGAPIIESTEPSIFSVQPEAIEIPPHEHRFVNIFFSPTEIKSYRALFKAEVEYSEKNEIVTTTKGGKNDTKGKEKEKPIEIERPGKILSFALGGTGTLPCIAVDQPAERLSSGQIPMTFSRTHIHRTSQRKLVIRNDGAMSATCLFDMSGDNDFHFPLRGSSLTVAPGQREETIISFCPTKVHGSSGERSASIRISVLHNPFDQYSIQMDAIAFACDVVIDTSVPEDDQTYSSFDQPSITYPTLAFPNSGENNNHEDFKMSDVNLAEGFGTSSHSILLRSRCNYPVLFDLSGDSSLSFLPSKGHLGPGMKREIVVTFSAETPLKLENSPINCSVKQIQYLDVSQSRSSSSSSSSSSESRAFEGDDSDEQENLQGLWDNSMKTLRPCTEEDLRIIAAAKAAQEEYLKAKDAFEKAKAKKSSKLPPLGPPPPACLIELVPLDDEESQGQGQGKGQQQMVYEIVPEPLNSLVESYEEQKISVKCNATADYARFRCVGEGENISFKPTFMFQCSQHKFTLSNDSSISLPIKWSFDDIKRRTNTRGGPQTAASTLRSRVGTASTSSLSMQSSSTPCPFFIEPEESIVSPNSQQDFILKFQPLDTFDYVFSLRGDSIPALLSLPPAPTQTIPPPTKGSAAVAPPASSIPDPSELELRGPVRMVLRGSAKRPYCHFELTETRDYLSRRPPNLKNENGIFSPIEDSEIRVVEVESVGLRTRNTFRFNIINPTNENYEFLWEAIGDPSSFWRCLQQSGMLFAGKRVEVAFEYLPEELPTAEAFFKFRLPLVGLEQIFLFAGQVKEPKVFFSTSRVDFHSVMLGGEGCTEIVYLENDEQTPFHFLFDKSALQQLEGLSGTVLEIEPKIGVVPPHSRFPISFSFHPQEEIIYNFNVVCEVKRKPNKLSINFKGEGYAVHPFIQLEQPEDTSGSLALAAGVRYQTLRPHPSVNYADFGVVQVLDSLSKSFSVANQGKYNFDYAWDTDRMGPSLSLSGGKLGGTLHKGEEMTYQITFAPQSVSTLDGASLSFTVAGKYTYNLLMRGTAVEPALRFSFLSYDFGPCFITSPGGSTVTEEAVLKLINHDPSNNISVECGFQKMRALWVDCPPTVLGPGHAMDVVLSFAPRDVKDYTFVVPFIVNGTTKVPVKIIGRGCNARLELSNPGQRRLNFGTIDVGSESRKIVPIVNRSKKALPVQLVENGDFSTSMLDDKCISYAPRSEFIIPPRETVNLQIAFSPSKRISTFNEDLMVRYAGVTRKLLSLSGKAQGLEASLDTDSLPFGVVVLDSMKTKKISLENTGDLSLTFQWLEGTFGRHFTISPLSGKLSPGAEQTFDVTFRPRFPDEDIRQDGITLVVPGLYNLTLTCTGACIQQPAENVQILQFRSLARKEDIKSISISNPTDKDWHLSPSLSGEDWRSPHEFKVPARGSANLQLVYYPLSMSRLEGYPQAQNLFTTQAAPETKVKGKAAPVQDTDPFSYLPSEVLHQGQLFIALPDGNALLYNLKGLAGPPECSGQISVDTPAKKAAVVTARLANWLGKTQKFNVEVDMLSQASPATSIIVANAVEVGPNGTKEFPIRFLSFTEGMSTARITFRNPISGEYSYYELQARTTMAEVLETLSLESSVRQTARYPITIDNPLKGAPVNMGSVSKPDDWWSCGAPDIKVNILTPFTGNAEASFEVEYRPLKPTTHPQEHLLTITSQELGTFKYKLILTASPPASKQTLRFEVPLGLALTESLLIRTYNPIKCDFACSLRKPEFFSVPSSLSVDSSASWSGSDVRVNVTFEPTEIGEIQDTLLLRNPDWGEYECELVATCVAPMPQGPFNLTQGGGAVEIPFRNCFPQASNWTFSVDSPAFRLLSPTLQVAAKTQGKVQVSFEPPSEMLTVPGGIITAKLFVACTAKPSVAPWVFYLRGKIDPNAPLPNTKASKK